MSCHRSIVMTRVADKSNQKPEVISVQNSIFLMSFLFCKIDVCFLLGEGVVFGAPKVRKSHRAGSILCGDPFRRDKMHIAKCKLTPLHQTTPVLSF